MRVTGVVLAAGSATRFGSLKQLALFRGKPLVRHVTETVIASGCDQVLVVTSGDALDDALSGLGVRIVVNENAGEGIASSIRLAVTEAPAGRLLLALADQPLVSPAHLKALITCDAPIAASRYAGIDGVPAIFSNALRNELLELRGDRGARSVIEKHHDQVVSIEFEAAAIDIDTPRDLQRLGSPD